MAQDEAEQGLGPRWETKVLNVANQNTVFSSMLYQLVEEGHLRIDTSTSEIRFITARDRAIAEALHLFATSLPVPSLDERELRESMEAFTRSSQALDRLIPGMALHLVETFLKNPTFAYSTTPAELIIADQAELGWVFESKEEVVENGVALGTSYRFRRVVAGAVAERGEGVLIDTTKRRATTATDTGVQAAMLYNEGNALGRQNRHEEAIKYYQAALRLDPSNASIYNNLATSYKNLRRWREAESAYRQALQADPMYNRAHFRLACMYVLQGREREVEQEIHWFLDSGGTIAEAETMVVDIDGEADIRRLMARVQRERQKAAGFTTPTQEEKKAAEVEFSEGMRLREFDLEGAAVAFRHAIRHDPQHGLAHRELGRVLYDMQADDDVLRHLERATELLPDDAETWLLYGERCSNFWHPERALVAYDRAYSLAPDDYSANLMLGMHLTSRVEGGQTRERAEEAEGLLRKALALKPNEYLPYWMLGRLYTAIGNLEQARQTYRRALALFPDNSSIKRELEKLEPAKEQRFFGRARGQK